MAKPTADVFAARRRAVMKHAVELAKADKKKVDGVLLTHPTDVRYCTGMPEGAAALVTDGESALLVTSPMFRDAAPKQASVDEIVIFDPPQKADEALKKALAGKGFRRLAIQADKLSLGRYRQLVEHLGERRLVELKAIVDEARAAKDASELRLIRKTVKIAEDAFSELIAGGAKALIGRTEKELSHELERLMRQRNADGQGFPGGIIVGSGPNAASCHHFPTTRKCRANEVVLFDWGAELDAYRSDITRVVYLKQPPAKLAEAHPVVEAALAAATAQVGPGADGKAIDAAARQVLADGGYGDLRHGTGHGLGLDIHEAPSLGKTSESKLKAGHVVTVEPGIYLDGLGGIRLEDDVLVTEKGRTILTKLPRDLGSAILP